MTASLLWREVERRFDPHRPPEAPWWVARSQGNLRRVRAALAQTSGAVRVVLAGPPGTGKTTELRRLAQARAADDFVIYVDLEAHLRDVALDPEAVDRLAPWEVAALTALALERAGRAVFADRWPGKEVAWLDKAMAVAGFRGQTPWTLLASCVALRTHRPSAGRVAPELSPMGRPPFDVFWDAPLGNDGAIDDRDRWVTDVIESVSRLIRRVSQLARRRVLILIDGLDRMAGPDLESRIVRYGQLLARLPAQTVVALPYVAWSVAGTLDRVGVRVQPMTPPTVHERSEPPRYGPGVAYLTEVFAARTLDLAGDTALLSTAQISRLAYYSGGLLHHFIKLVHEVAAITGPTQRLWVADDTLDMVLSEERHRLAASLSGAELDLLVAVVEDPFGGQGRAPEAQSLYAGGRLVPVPGPPPWNMPHPLLWQALGLG